MFHILQDSLLPDRFLDPRLSLNIERVCIQTRDLCVGIDVSRSRLPQQFSETCRIVSSSGGDFRVCLTIQTRDEYRLK